eukprot:1394205-Amorphochlora_amoeboformis.AAC.2
MTLALTATKSHCTGPQSFPLFSIQSKLSVYLLFFILSAPYSVGKGHHRGHDESTLEPEGTNM